MSRRTKLYEGKATILYEGPEPGTLIQYFKDDATAFNAEKKGTINGKGVINNRISEHVFTRLAHIGIPTHFIRRLNMREQLIRQVEIIPLEVVLRNVAAGSISKRLGIEEGEPLPHTLIEYYYKDDALGDPLVAEEHIACFNWCSNEEMHDISSMAIRISRLARCMPTHICGPKPQERSLGFRSKLTCSGLGNSSGSRPASVVDITTLSPGIILTPPNSVSFVQVRNVVTAA